MVSIGTMIAIAVVFYLVGFMTCGYLCKGRQEDLEGALWGVLCHPGENSRERARDVLRGA